MNEMYLTGQEQMSDEELIAQALIRAHAIIERRDAELSAANETIQEQRQMITDMKPKALFADAVEASHTAILVGELAKLLRQNGVNVGNNRLFELLRADGYIVEDSALPTQYSIKHGLMKIRERIIHNPDGSMKITQTPLITGKGQTYFVNYFLTRVGNAGEVREAIQDE